MRRTGGIRLLAALLLLGLSGCGSDGGSPHFGGIAIRSLPPPVAHPALPLQDVACAGRFAVVTSSHHLALYRNGVGHPLYRRHSTGLLPNPAINAQGDVAVPVGVGQVGIYTPSGHVYQWTVPGNRRLSFFAVGAASRGRWLVSTSSQVWLLTTRGRPLTRFPGGGLAMALSVPQGVVTWNPLTVTARLYGWNGTLRVTRSFPLLRTLNAGVAGSSAGVGALVPIPVAPGFAITSSGGTLVPTATVGSVARVLGGYVVPAGSVAFGLRGQTWSLTTWQGRWLQMPYANNLATPLTSSRSGAVLAMALMPGPGTIVIDRQGRVLARLPGNPNVACISADERWLYVLTRYRLLRVGPLPRDGSRPLTGR